YLALPNNTPGILGPVSPTLASARRYRPASRPIHWHPKRAVFIRPEISPDYLSKRERQMLRLLARNGRLSRTQLQQRVSYLIPTSILDFLLNRLLAQQLIAITDDGWIRIHRTSPAL